MKSGQEDYNHWIDIKDLTDTITFVPTKSNVNFDKTVLQQMEIKYFMSSVSGHASKTWFGNKGRPSILLSSSQVSDQIIPDTIVGRR